LYTQREVGAIWVQQSTSANVDLNGTSAQIRRFSAIVERSAMFKRVIRR